MDDLVLQINIYFGTSSCTGSLGASVDVVIVSSFSVAADFSVVWECVFRGGRAVLSAVYQSGVWPEMTAVRA